MLPETKNTGHAAVCIIALFIIIIFLINASSQMLPTADKCCF